MKRAVAIFSLILLMVAFTTPDLFAQGCSQCRLIPKSNMETGGTVGAALNPAILYLMAIPYIILFLLFRKKIVGFVKYFFVYHKR